MEHHLKNFVLSLLAYAVQRDVSPEVLCKFSGITLADIRSDKEVGFTQKQMHDLWLNAARLSKDPVFGLHFGESLQLSALGIVGELIKSSATVGEALVQAASLTHLVTPLFHLEIMRNESTFTVHFLPLCDEQLSLSPDARHTLDMLMVMVIHELDGLLLQKIEPESVQYVRTIANLPEYQRVMRCQAIETADAYAIQFDIKYWDEPILTANYALQKILLDKVTQFKPALPEQQTMHTRIYSYLLANSYLGMVSLTDIAANFNISARTLQRNLQEEGVSFQQLADQVRKSLALHYLNAGQYSVKEVSCLLGYNELSAFTRAFKRWTGVPPRMYQKK